MALALVGFLYYRLLRHVVISILCSVAEPNSPSPFSSHPVQDIRRIFRDGGHSRPLSDALGVRIQEALELEDPGKRREVWSSIGLGRKIQPPPFNGDRYRKASGVR